MNPSENRKKSVNVLIRHPTSLKRHKTFQTKNLRVRKPSLLTPLKFMILRFLFIAFLLQNIAGMVLYPRNDEGLGSIGNTASEHNTQKKGFKTRTEVRIGFSVDIDVGRLTAIILNAKILADNRGSFVKAALLESAYSGKGKYSVLVFNLANDFIWHDVPDFDRTIYTPMYYGPYIYGIWIFQGPAKFENRGDGGIDNWAFFGRTEQVKNNLTFYAM